MTSPAQGVLFLALYLLVVLLIVLGAVVIWRGPKTLPKLGEALAGVRYLVGNGEVRRDE